MIGLLTTWVTCPFIFASFYFEIHSTSPTFVIYYSIPSCRIPQVGPSFAEMRPTDLPQLSLRHLPDLSDTSFQIPQTGNDLLLADGSDDFFHGADDTLTTPPSRILSGLTFDHHASGPSLYKEPKPFELPNSPSFLPENRDRPLTLSELTPKRTLRDTGPSTSPVPPSEPVLSPRLENNVKQVREQKTVKPTRPPNLSTQRKRQDPSGQNVDRKSKPKLVVRTGGSLSVKEAAQSPRPVQFESLKRKVEMLADDAGRPETEASPAERSPIRNTFGHRDTKPNLRVREKSPSDGHAKTAMGVRPKLRVRDQLKPPAKPVRRPLYAVYKLPTDL
jgi:hypothetical protein